MALEPRRRETGVLDSRQVRRVTRRTSPATTNWWTRCPRTADRPQQPAPRLNGHRSAMTHEARPRDPPDPAAGAGVRVARAPRRPAPG
ncbi:hypothetical protein QJS66_12830 [Kocuria rhizophila]|nr:hypothetical protein QJS66_12830 [Kocuria rhizophila]